MYKKELGGEYKIAKSLTATTFTEPNNSQFGSILYYRVVAFYQSTQCESNFATVLDHPEWRELEVNRTMIPMHLKANNNESDRLLLEWQPAFAADAYNVYCNGALIAQNVTETNYTVSNEISAAVYYVTGIQGEVESSPSNKIYYGSYGIEDLIDDVMMVFPNPANEVVTVTITGLKSVSLYNMLGQEVLKAVATENACNLDLTGLQSGLYLIKACTISGNNIQKLIIK